MLKVHIFTPLEGVRLLPFLAAPAKEEKRLFQTLPSGEYEGLVEQTSLADADIAVIPHEYATFRNSTAALEEFLSLARESGKPVLLSAYQDDPSPLHVNNAIILRASAYKSTLLSNEIVMPAYVEDVGALFGTTPVRKMDKASVGFVGKAGFAGAKELIRYYLKNHIIYHGVHKEGVYFRRNAMRFLAKHPSVETLFVVRKTFSAHKDSIELPPEEARSEYLKNMKNSLFTLAPRGDGNFSLRFFETLSMGRIPLVIDTDMPLPLEDRINYDDFIVRIPWRDMENIGDYVDKFFSLSEDELIRRQHLARQAFEQYLYMPRFLKTVLNRQFLSNLSPELFNK